MRLKADRVEAKEVTVVADNAVSMNANIMKEDIEKYAELTEVYSGHPAPKAIFIGSPVY